MRPLRGIAQGYKMKISKREKTFAIITAIIVIFAICYRYSGSILSKTLMGHGAILSQKEKLFESYKKSIRRRESIEKEYDEIVGTYTGSSQNQFKKEEDIFSENVAKICKEMNNPYPTISQSTDNPLEGVDNYKEITLTVSVSNNYENVIKLLKRFNTSSYLIKNLTLRCPTNKTILEFDITLSKIVKTDVSEQKEKRKAARVEK